ncbi:MAG: hypothetical protein ABJA70_20185 [Chryseolinea sp.]
MNSIRTYEELVAERKRLEGNLLIQRTYIKTHLHEISRKLQPLTKLFGIIGKLNNGSNVSSLLKFGSTVGIDLLIGQKLKKVGWLAKLLIPFAMKLTSKKTFDKVRDKITK